MSQRYGSADPDPHQNVTDPRRCASNRGAKIYVSRVMSLKAAEEALPKIVAIMADELGWDDKEKLRQTDLAIQFLR